MEPPALLALALGTLGVIAAFPAPPAVSPSVSLSLPSPLFQGTPFNVTCVTNVTADAVTVTADGRNFPASLSGDGHRATATVTVTRTGRVPLGCTVHVGDRESGAGQNVHVYNIPAPILNVTNARPAAGTELRGRCSLPAGAVRDIQVRVLAGDKVLAGWGQPALDFALAVGEEDAEELELLCQAELENVSRNSSVPVTVLVKPRLDARSCPSPQNWTEGREETLRCRARGRPDPRIRCSRDGDALDAASSLRAHRDHAGVYRCRATNELGTAESNVTVWVHCA
ncbi:intercellular adhesion molecule 5-like [Chamaea fasciata]|uniref:intercellular adhesion molecule 5-like n=1 Tax=Chamaea fasciata TaxID=190680 RepID=UPI003369CD0B